MMDTLTDDIICNIATFCMPNDLVNLGRACQRFGGKPGGFAVAKKKKRKSIYSTRKRQKTASSIGKTAAQKKKDAERLKAVEMVGGDWSLMEEVARKIVEKANESDNEWRDFRLSKRVNKKESWVTVYHRLEQWIRTPLKFSRFLGNAPDYVKGDISHVRSRKFCESLAFCQEVMKTGRHYAEFTITPTGKGKSWKYWGGRWSWSATPIGLMRPIPEGETVLPKTPVTGIHWFYNMYCEEHGERLGFEPNILGEGMGWEQGEHSCLVNVHLRKSYRFGLPFDLYIRDDEPDGMVIGLLLDLDKGTLTVYQQGRNRGVIVKGLRGHYCWTAYPTDCSVKIQQAPIPADA